MNIFGDVYRNKKVLVTGHTGFKGSWLSEWLLLLGAEVTGYSLPPPTRPSLFEQLGLDSRMLNTVGDVRDLAALTRQVKETAPDFVFHLAAQSLVRRSYADPVETYATNIMGTVNLLEALRCANISCAVVVVTTDKCYENKEWLYGYREEDPLGGHDPYSSSKAAVELVVAAYRRSYFGSELQALSSSSGIRLASARAGNVIGGGDWAVDRIVPDCIRALQRSESIPVRNKIATRPWQHVLEPLSGYLWLAACLAAPALSPPYSRSCGSVTAIEGGRSFERGQAERPALRSLTGAFNFGPTLDSNRTVTELVQEVLKHWPGEWADRSDPQAVHEASRLNLAIDKAHHLLGWSPVWDFATTIAETIRWYRQSRDARQITSMTRAQLVDHVAAAKRKELCWACPQNRMVR